MTDEEQDEQFYRDTESIAFPKLNDHQLSLLEPLAERRVMKRGDVLFKAGQRDLGLAIVLRGEIEAFETRDGTEYNLATARERDFIGRRSDAPGNIDPWIVQSHIGRGRDPSHSGSRTSARAGGNSRREQDNRRCIDHATATAPPRSRICGHACSGQPRCARWTSAR